MRIALIHPNYHSGGAEIAGNWPPAWAADLSGWLTGASSTGPTTFYLPMNTKVAIPNLARG